MVKVQLHLAQSVGGGGGYNAFSTATNNVNTDRNFLGSNTSKNTSAGDIELINQGESIITRGESSPGVLVQSVGGGGGWSAIEGSKVGSGRLGMNKGINAAGGQLEVTNSADITTLGDHAHALRLQSIGGGGGAFSASVQEMQIGSKNSSGFLSGGDIELITSGSAQTQGSGSVGVNVMSLGGGGGSLFGEANDTVRMGSLDEYNSGEIVVAMLEILM